MDVAIDEVGETYAYNCSMDAGTSGYEPGRSITYV
jgi:hypothetical protein